MTEERKAQIVILGGGFGGLYTALELEKRLAREPAVEITLVNRDNFFLFTPMLHEVAASDLDVTHIVNPMRKLLRRTRFVEGNVDAIDLSGRAILVTHGAERHPHELDYDHLVIALGSSSNYFGLPGLAAHALTMRTLGDAIRLRNRLIENLEAASFECASEEREPLLSFVVAGGGFAGVETIAALNDFAREALRFYPSLDESQLRMILVHSGPMILPELGQELGLFAARKLRGRGVEIHCNTRVRAATDRSVELSDGVTLTTKTLVWTAGNSPHPLLATIGCPKEKGRLRVEPSLEVPGWPGVWAVGDCAWISDPRTGQAYPPTAQHALREGRLVARNIAAAIRGDEKKPFVFSTLGQLAAIGRRTGVARIFGINFSGFLAWWLWRTIYLSKLPRFEKKLRVALDWTLDLAFSKDLVQLDTGLGPVGSASETGRLPTPERQTA